MILKNKLANFVKIFGIKMIKEHRNEWWSCCGTRMWAGLKLMTQNLNKYLILVFSKADEVENGAKTDHLMGWRIWKRSIQDGRQS